MGAFDPEIPLPAARSGFVITAPHARLLRDALVEWSFILALWIAMFAAPAPFDVALYPLFALLVGGRIHALASLAHDAAHLPHKRGALPFLVEVVCAWPIATTVLALRAHHLRHHRHTNTDDDPYFHPRWPMPARFAAVTLLVPWWTLRVFAGALASVVPALRPTYATLWLFRPRGRAGERDEVLLCARADVRLFFGISALAALAAALPGVVAFAWLVPLCAAMLLNAARFVREHTDEARVDSSDETMRAVTRNVGDSLLARLLLAPRGLGFHVEHHLHPSASHHALAAIARAHSTRTPAVRHGEH